MFCGPGDVLLKIVPELRRFLAPLAPLMVQVVACALYHGGELAEFVDCRGKAVTGDLQRLCSLFEASGDDGEDLAGGEFAHGFIIGEEKAKSSSLK